MSPPVVVDTNILFSALVSRRSRLREILLTDARLWTEDDELKKGLRPRGWDLFFEP